MNRLRTTTRWIPNVPILAEFRDSHVVICSLNTRALSLHKDDIYFDYNLQASHILCLNETHFDLKISDITSFFDTSKY